MNKLKKYTLNKVIQEFESIDAYFENLEIDAREFKELSTPSKRTGCMGKTKQKWRVSDGIDYPVITYKASDLKEVTAHE